METRAGSNRTVADSVARFTLAPPTPSTFSRKRVMRFTHEAHVMPSTGKDTISMGWAGRSDGVWWVIAVMARYSWGVFWQPAREPATAVACSGGAAENRDRHRSLGARPCRGW